MNVYFMKNHLLLLILFPFVVSAQLERGLSPLHSESGTSEADRTYAVVVGISDYQDKDIPDLRFADKDALAFAGFMQSPAGGSLDEDHLKVLINEKATAAQFAIALDWLMDVVKENDRAIIYFSGHGDVERKTITQPGYFLCWDAPSRVYMAGGALALPIFQDVVSTLSIQNKAKVIVVTDACHSGKLSGSSVGGAQLTNSNLSRQYANEIKILSCQPDEYSIEGEQWGGGRGAFSYHLLDGLYGMADGNADGTVNLKEISRYLEDRVSEEVNPQHQNPMTLGNVTEKLANVFPELLAKLKAGKKGQMQLFAATESRGIEDNVLTAADTHVVEMYFAFKKSLEDKQFLFAESGRAENDYADFYYKKLSEEPSLEKLHSSMRRNYAAALQDDAQQVMNKWLMTEISELNLTKISQTVKYKSYPRYLERAAELLGSQHYMYPVLKARKLYFEGYLLSLEHTYPDKKQGAAALKKFREALVFQPNMPHAYRSMSMVFGYNMLQPDSMEYYTQLAMDQSPSWVIPATSAAYILSEKYSEFDRSKYYLEKASQIDSNSVIVLNYWGIYYHSIHRYDEAEKYYRKAIQLDSTFTFPYNNLGLTYRVTGRYAEAEGQYKKAIQLDSTDTGSYNNLGFLYQSTKRYAEAEGQYKKAIQLDSTLTAAYNNLGNLYSHVRQYTEAERQYKKVIQLDSTNAEAYNNLGSLYIDIRRYTEAEEQYKKVIQLDSTKSNGYNNLGFVYMRTQQYPEAEAQYKKAIQLDSAYVLSYYNLGKIYIATERYHDAEKYCKKVIQLDSTFAPGYTNLGNVYKATQRYDEAEQQYRKTIQFDSTNTVAYNHLGLLYKNAQRYAEAELQYIKVIELDSTHWAAYANLGVQHQTLLRWEESAYMLQKAIALGPPIGQLVALLGNAYTHMPGRLADAKTALEKGLDMSPDSPDTYIFLAQWSLKMNQQEEAWQYLEQGLEKGIGNEELKPEDLQERPDFEEIRKDARWGELMGKYFPEQNNK